MSMLFTLISYFPAVQNDQEPGVGSEASAQDGIKDATGEIDLSMGQLWETVDGMVDGFVSRLPAIVIGIVVFLAFYFLAKFAKSLIRKYTSNRESANLGKVIGRLAQWAIVFLGLMIAVSIISPSVKPGDLLAGLGVGGVAIGFAFRDILQNFLSGILILLREPFKVGDQIRSGDFEGTVESIETRATFIKTYDGKQVVIPNSQIYTSPVVVNTAFELRRTQYDVGIGCNDDLRNAATIMHRVMQETDGVAGDPAPDVLCVELADSSVNLRCRWWTASDQATVMKTRHEVIARIKVALDEAAIDMPYPTQVVLFHDQTEETDGVRAKQREGWPTDGNDPKTRRIADRNKVDASQ